MKKWGRLSTIHSMDCGVTVLLGILLSLGTGSLAGAEGKKGGLDDFMIKKGYEVVPLVGDDRILQHIYGTVNGTRTKLLIHPYSDVSAIDNSLTRNLEPVDHRKEALHGLFENSDLAEVPIVQVEHLEAGSVKFVAQKMAAYNLHVGKRAATGSNIGSANSNGSLFASYYDVWLGMDFLRANHAILHLAGNKLFVRKEQPDAAVVASVKATMLASGWAEAPVAAPSRGRLYLSALIDGHPARMVVSTSDRYSYLDLRILPDFGLSTEELVGRYRRSKDQSAALATTTVGLLKIGDSAGLTRVKIGARDFKHVNEDEAKRELPPLQGVLGDECLSQWIAVIDFSEPAVYLRKDLITK